MDNWESLMWRSLPDDHFVVEDESYTILSIHRAIEGNSAPLFEKKTVARESVRKWAEAATTTTTLSQDEAVPAATFQCLIISTHDFNDFPVDISRDSLFDVSGALGIPPVQTQLLFAPYTGHVIFDRHMRWYYGRPGLRALASTDSRTGCTNAIVTVNGSERSAFEEDLHRFSRVCGHPLMLALAIRVNSLKTAFELTQKLVTSLRDAERLSGFHADYEGDNSDEESSSNPRGSQVLDLGKLSRKVASDASNLGNVKIILAKLVSLRAMLHSEDGTLKWQAHFGNPVLQQNYAAQSEDMIGIDVVFESMRQSLLEAVAEYQGRARNLQSVLFNLIAREDADASIQLAKGSRMIAAATKKDGESMKTIAIMTMIFLPGTFYSALFAVPSLQWSQSPVIQHNFWVYWAFTIPSTILILSAWYILGRRRNNKQQQSRQVTHISSAAHNRSLVGFPGLLRYNRGDRTSNREQNDSRSQTRKHNTMMRTRQHPLDHSQSNHSAPYEKESHANFHTSRKDVKSSTVDDMA